MPVPSPPGSAPGTTSDSRITAGTGRPRIAVFDIDGVVADVRHRLHHLEGQRKDWSAFFEAAAHDPMLQEGVQRAEQAASDASLVWLTGRPQWLQATTEGWLEAAGLPADRMLMRPRRDFRPARVFKLECVEALAREADIVVVVDDDPEVCAALAAEGWPVEQAEWVTYTRTLRTAQERRGRT